MSRRLQTAGVFSEHVQYIQYICIFTLLSISFYLVKKKASVPQVLCQSLEQEFANFFSQSSESKDFQLRRPCGLCHNGSAVVAQSSQGQYVWNGRGCVPNKTPLTEIDSWPYSAHEPQFTNRWSRAKNTGYRQGQVRTYSVSIISLPQIPYSTFIIRGIIIPSLLSIKWKTGRELIKTNFLHPIAILSVRHFPQFFIHTIISDKWLFLNIISPSSCSYSARLIERHHPLIP